MAVTRGVYREDQINLFTTMLFAFRLSHSRFLLAASLLTAGAVHAARPRHLARELPADGGVTATGAVNDSPASAPTPAVFATAKLPPLPKGVAELKFHELFRQPVGPRGLELTESLRQLDGRRVRILGYMVEQSRPAPHCLLLSPMPIKLHEDEWGFCEDLPANVIHVFVNPSAPELVPFTPGPLLLTGTLSVGNRIEPDQRVSTVRLQLDAPPTDALTPTEDVPTPVSTNRAP